MIDFFLQLFDAPRAIAGGVFIGIVLTIICGGLLIAFFDLD